MASVPRLGARSGGASAAEQGEGGAPWYLERGSRPPRRLRDRTGLYKGRDLRLSGDGGLLDLRQQGQSPRQRPPYNLA